MESYNKPTKIEPFNIYQSANSDKESIKTIFILRQTEFQDIYNSLSRPNPKKPLQHELILGRRGSGKSILLKRIEIEIDEKLNKKYIPVNLAEEQASIYRLFDLWQEIIEVLKKRYSFQTEIKDYSEFNGEQNYTKYLYQQIHEFCISLKKQIVLLLDNFDRIVENFTKEGNNLFREILINFNDVIVIAASTRIDEQFWQDDNPFYDFFRYHHLESLTIDEIKKLLNHWAEVANIPELSIFVTNNTGKLHSIRLITDGLPRTFQFLIQLLVQNNYANKGVDYFKKIMDNITPLYQEQLNGLTPQLRKIVLEMAFIWEACNTKDLVEKCKLESKLISANLRTLAKKGVVEKIKTGKRNLLYRISERIFNIWLIITQGNSEQKQKAEWLNLFLENWYDSFFLITKTQNFSPELKEQLFFFDEIQNYKKTNAKENADDGFSFFDLGNIQRVQTIYSDVEKYFLSEIGKGKVAAMYNLGNYYAEHGRLEEAEKYYLNAIEQGHINSIYNLGLTYTYLEKFEEAEKYYLLAIEKEMVNAMYNLGLLYANKRKIQKAEKYYLMAIERGNISAMYNWGNKYAKQGKFQIAEKYYLLAIEKGHVNAMYNLGVLYTNQGKYGKAEKYYLAALEKGHLNAIYNLGLLYENRGNEEEAENYYLLATEKGHVDAMFNLANLYANQGNVEKAERYYLMAIENDDTNAICSLGFLYANQGKYGKAEKYYLLAMEKNRNEAFCNLASLYYRQNRNKADALEYIKQYERNEALRIVIELWNGILDEVEKRTLKVIKQSNFLNWFIIELLIHQQGALVLKLFNHPEEGQRLQDRLKILYYVCLLLNSKIKDYLLLKIPPEIQTTIDEVISYINEKEKFYGYKE